MANKVNPPIAVLSNTQFGSLAYKLGLEEILRQLWTRTGGGDDSVAAADTKELFSWQGVDKTSDIDSIFNQPVQEQVQMPAFVIGQKSRELVSTASNYTTAGDEIVEATSNITVSLNASPDEGETVTAKRNTTAGTVTVSGNGKNIDGAATHLLTINYDSRTFIYSASSGEWLVI